MPMARRQRSASSAGFQPVSGGARTPTGDPLAGVEHVYIDGSNLIHALARGGAYGGGRGYGERVEGHRGRASASDAGSSTGAPASAIIGRLRAAFPPAVVVDLVFDGPAYGGIKGRLATGLRVSYSGRLSADEVIYEGVAAQLAADGPAATWSILVVTDDRRLREEVTGQGARTAGTGWLGGRIGRLGVDGPPTRSGPSARAAGRRGRRPPEGGDHDRSPAAAAGTGARP